MLDSSSLVPAAPVPTHAVQPPASATTPRIVESTAQSTLHQQGGVTVAPQLNPLQELARSARQFAEILDATGNVQVASVISGFRLGHLDTYA
jgi:hypothetical protein